MVRYEQKSKKRRSGVQREKRKEKGRNGAEESRGANKKGNARGIITRRAASCRASFLPRNKVTFQVTSRFLAPRPIFFNPWNVRLDPGKTGTRIETNRTATVTKYGNRENSSG